MTDIPISPELIKTIAGTISIPSPGTCSIREIVHLVDIIEKKTGIKFVTNGDKIDTFYFSTFFGGSEPGYAPGVDCHIWFDDIVISTSNPLTAT